MAARTFRLIRPDDLLVLDVTLVNLALGADGLLHADNAADPARLVIGIAPQHIAEQAFLEFEDSRETAGPPPVRAVAALPSRLAFEVPAEHPGIPFTVGGLLDWSDLPPALAPNALPPGTAAGPRPAPPAPDVTALELAYRLTVSPVTPVRWQHRLDPFAPGGVAELWHSTLIPVAADRAALRAIFGRVERPDRFRSSLSTQDITDLVTLTGDFGNIPKSAAELGMTFTEWGMLMFRLRRLGPPVPPPATLTAKHLRISALGADAHLLGKFDFPRDDQSPADLRKLGIVAPSLMQYEHITGQGRDQYVKVVRRGCLDTGHRASIVKITERRFEPVQLGTEPGPNGPTSIFGTTAYLRQYYRIVVQQPYLDYRRMIGAYPHAGREMPLRTIVLRTLETPKINIPGLPNPTPATTQADIDHALQAPFWITSGADSRPVPFDFESVDGEGRTVSGTKAMMFVPYDALPDTDTVISTYHLAPLGRRLATFRAQQLAVAEPLPGKRDATSLPVEQLVMELVKRGPGNVPADYIPGWLPRAVGAEVHLEPLERLTGSTAAVQIALSNVYLNSGFDPAANPASLFANYLPTTLGLGAERGGGVAAPVIKLDALSATQGTMPAAMAGPVTAATLAPLLAGMKLFGTVELSTLVAELAGPPDARDIAGALPEAALDSLLADPVGLVPIPVIRTRPLLDGAGRPTATVTRLVWKPPLRPSVGPFSLAGAQLVLDVRTVTRLDGSPPETAVRGELRGFALTFAGVVRLSMGVLRFTTLPGRKPDVTAEGVGLEFIGPLQFVNTIRQLLPADGFSDPPVIAVTPEGITAGFSLGIPSAGVGVFSLQNMSLSAMLSLPFAGKPAGLRFALSDRHHPFLVTVTVFGGGGYFALGVSSSGVEEIEASIEFGGNVSMNIGVASGGLYVMAGVYFAMSATKGCELSGYLRCGGYLSVLGLVSISVEFYLAFTYRSKGGGRVEIWGQASVTVSVKVVCFSKSVTLSVEKRIAGPAGDPTLDDVLDGDDWQAYCLAFAEEQG